MGKILSRLPVHGVMSGETQGMAIPVGISNRHVHLSQQDVEALFGKGYHIESRSSISFLIGVSTTASTTFSKAASY